MPFRCLLYIINRHKCHKILSVFNAFSEYYLSEIDKIKFFILCVTLCVCLASSYLFPHIFFSLFAFNFLPVFFPLLFFLVHIFCKKKKMPNIIYLKDQKIKKNKKCLVFSLYKCADYGRFNFQSKAIFSQIHHSLPKFFCFFFVIFSKYG